MYYTITRLYPILFILLYSKTKVSLFHFLDYFFYRYRRYRKDKICLRKIRIFPSDYISLNIFLSVNHQQLILFFSLIQYYIFFYDHNLKTLRAVESIASHHWFSSNYFLSSYRVFNWLYYQTRYHNYLFFKLSSVREYPKHYSKRRKSVWEHPPSKEYSKTVKITAIRGDYSNDWELLS